MIVLLNCHEKLTYDYYSYPWEASADQLGGVRERKYKRPLLPKGGYNSYYDLIKLFYE